MGHQLGNEYGQVLMSVLSAGEGAGLDSTRIRGSPPRTLPTSDQKEEFLSLRKRRIVRRISCRSPRLECNQCTTWLTTCFSSGTAGH